MKLRRILTVIFSLLILNFTAFAQDCEDPEPPSDPDQPYEPPTCAVPLDTWVYVLVITGAGFGAYQLHRKQKSSII